MRKRPPLHPTRKTWAQQRNGAVFKGTPLTVPAVVSLKYAAKLDKMVEQMSKTTLRELVRLYRTDEARKLGLAMDSGFDPDQPRNEQGEWTDGGASTSTPKLTEQQRVDVKDYKEGGYRALNDYLRNPSSVRASLAAEYEGQAKRIDAAIHKSRLKADTVVYRGMKHAAVAKNAEKLIGREVPAAAFLSTSRSKKAASDFAGFDKNAVLFQIHAKAGTPALNMDQFQTEGNAGEQELLLSRKSKLRITGVDRSGRIPVVHAEAI